MRGIKLFIITYEEDGTPQTKEWPAQTPEHAVKRFQRARELSSKPPARIISVNPAHKPEPISRRVAA